MNRETIISQLTSSQATKIIDSLRKFFKDLPHLPDNIREFWVKITPWLAIIGAAFSALNGVHYILMAFGVRAPGYNFDNPIYWLILGVFSVVSAYIAFLSFPLLKERKYDGWVLLFWQAAIAVVMSAVSVLFGISHIITVILSALIGFYLTFEVESLYTVAGKVSAKVTEVTKTAKEHAKNK